MSQLSIVAGDEWADPRGLALIQPWGHGICWGGKLIENRIAWTNSSRRGRILLHASASKSRREHERAVDFAQRQGLAWRPPSLDRLPLGGIIGRARIDGVIRNEADMAAYAANVPGGEMQRRWWMGAFALVLADVEPIELIPCTGMLGFFRVPQEIAARAIAAPRLREAA